MAEQTGIEWCDSTFNPWWGCTKISRACDNCYAAVLDKRTGGNNWEGKNRRRTGVKNWNFLLRWQKQAPKFFDEHGRNRRVFTASMADIFDNQVPTEWRDDFWDYVRQCPDLIFLILTKRPQNIEKMKPEFWDDIKGHIWLGTTVENQEVANRNIPHLVKHDCAARFLSCEPLVGQVDLEWPDSFYPDGVPTCCSGKDCGCHGMPTEPPLIHNIDWVITGGETGPGSRNADPAWYRMLRDQCAHWKTPFLFKQWGDWDENQVRVLKKNSGRVLDGVTHDGYPNTGESNA